MKRHVQASVSLCLVLSLAATGCNQLADFAGGKTDNTDTNIDIPTDPPQEPAEVNKILGISNTALISAAQSTATVNGSGEQGAFIQNRTLTLSPYVIGQYEVTRELWVEVMSRLFDDVYKVTREYTYNGWTRNSSYSNYPSLEQQAWFSFLPKAFMDSYPDRVPRELTAGYNEGTNRSSAGSDSGSKPTNWDEKAKKAAALTEFLGSKAYGIGGDRDDITTYDRNDTQNDVFWRAASNADYLSWENRKLPMGNVQWHEAVVFCNYLSILSGLMPVYQIDRYIAWGTTGKNKAKAWLRFGSDSDYKYSDKDGGYDNRSGSRKYIRPDLWLPLFKDDNGTVEWRKDWEVGMDEGGRSLYRLQGTFRRWTEDTNSPKKLNPDSNIELDSLAYGDARTEEWLEAARRNPVSWLADRFWTYELPSNKTWGIRMERADKLAIYPIKTATYRFRDVLKNQRITFDQNSNGYRLPTEAEWEFAARGGNMNEAEWQSAYSGGDIVYTGGGIDPETQTANFSGAPIPVGSLKANRLGLHDMSGNIAEWVWDFKGGNKEQWIMRPINGSTNMIERNPTGQRSDQSSPTASNNTWSPIERIMRGGAYAEPEDQRSLLIRFTRNMPAIGSQSAFRDGYTNRENGGRSGIGKPTEASVSAAQQMGFRLARYGTGS